MANTETFSKGLMLSENNDSLLVSVIFNDGTNNVSTNDGALVVLGDLITDTLYQNSDIGAAGVTLVDFNVFKATAPATITDDVVIIDYVGVTSGMIAGNEYNEGSKLFGLKTQPGIAARARRVFKGDRFWLSADCFTSTMSPAIGRYAGITPNDTHHTVSTTAPAAGSYGVKIVAEKDFVTGMSTNGKLFLCLAI